MNHPPEVETKILGATERQLLPKLRGMGFKPHFEGILKAQWLMNPANGQKIRVREENDIVMVEHKAPAFGTSDQIKSLQETGFEARSFDATIKTLCLVGLEKFGLLSIKKRVSYVLNYSDPVNKIRLDFDTYSELMGKSIPEFLEVEATNPENVYEMVEALGFQRSDCRNYGPKELFRYYYPNEEIF